MVPELVLLDVNETLSDLSPLRETFAGIGLTAETVEPWFAAVLRDGFALTMLGDTPAFAELAAAEVDQRLRAARPQLDDGTVETAVEQVLGTFASLRPHPDVVDGLLTLRAAGVRVVTLSNGAATVARSLLSELVPPGTIERYLTVADAGRWKPAPEAYDYALRVCAVAPAAALLVAVHPWDLEGAHRAGLRTGWLNRRGTVYPSTFTTPDLTATTLAELAETVTVGARPGR